MINYLADLRRDPKITWNETTKAFNEKFTLDKKQNSLSRHYSYLIKTEKIILDFAEDTEVIRALQRQLDAVKRLYQSEKTKTAAIVQAVIDKISTMTLSPITPPKKRKEKTENLSMHLMRSDAQAGSKIEPRATSGLGQYDFDIYKERVNKLRDKVLLFKEQDSKSLGLEKLVIPWLGDQIEGEDIYAGQQTHIDRITIDQMLDSAWHEINNFLLPLAKEFHSIEIFAVRGNHGRVGRKGQYNERTNFDYIFYRFVQTILHFTAPNVKMFVSESPAMLVEHGKALFCYKHGDDVVGWMGMPYYGLDRMSRRTSDMFRKPIDHYCIAHFHTSANLYDKILVGGTLVGGSDLSINKMNVTSIPSQKMFYFHDKHGINRESNLRVADPVDLQPDKDGIYTPIAPSVEEMLKRIKIED